MTPIYDLLNEAMRDSFGGSVTRLSEACDVSVALGSRWLHEDERKRIIPSPASCEKIAAGLGLDTDDVLAAAGHRRPKEDAVRARPTRLAAFIAQVEAAFHAMTDQEWSVREEAGRALFSVPPTDANAHRTARATTPRNRHSAPSAPENRDFDNPQSLRYRFFGHSLATA